MMDTLELATPGPVIPVLVIERLADAVPMAEALVAGGLRVLEVTLRTPVALQAIEAMARAVPQAIVGAGTLRTAQDAGAASSAGARFAVSPGFSAALAEACRLRQLPLLPGVATPSEVMAATDAGFRFLKFFPAEAAGGVPMLKSLAGPFPEVAFCPTGGIQPGNLANYLAQPNVRVCGGSWLTPADAVRAGDWGHLTELARKATALRPGG